MLQIAYEFMLRLYNKFKPEDMPDAKQEWTLDKRDLSKQHEEIFEKMVDDLFGEASKLENEQFKKEMESKYSIYLQAHELRNRVYEKNFGAIEAPEPQATK